MRRDITLGQYYPVDSLVHRMDPRAKILITLAYIVLVFFVSNYWGYLLLLCAIVGVCLLARLPVRLLLRSLKPLRFILIFTFILNLFFQSEGKPQVEWWIFRITDVGLHSAVFMTLRMAFLVAGTCILMLSTSPISLTDGIERLLSPLKKIRFPAHEMAMMMTIALRFIPTLIDEADKIMKAQMARGADFESGNLIARAKALVPLLVPLFVSAFRRADELAMAMESRCYHGGEGRTRMTVLKYRRNDLLGMLGMVALFVVIVLWG